MAASFRRTIVVRGQKEKTKGVGAKGEWTMYLVDAETTDGKAITEELKTFEALPHGEPVEVECEEQHHERYGTSYLLRRPKGHGGGGGSSQGGDLSRRVTELERRVDELEMRSAGI